MCVWSVCACQLGAGRSWAGLPGLAGWTTKGIREAWQGDEGGGGGGEGVKESCI